MTANAQSSALGLSAEPLRERPNSEHEVEMTDTRNKALALPDIEEIVQQAKDRH